MSVLNQALRGAEVVVPLSAYVTSRSTFLLSFSPAASARRCYRAEKERLLEQKLEDGDEDEEQELEEGLFVMQVTIVANCKVSASC